MPDDTKLLEKLAESLRETLGASFAASELLSDRLPDDDPVATTRYAVNCGTDGVKFHLLHILQNTALAREYEKGRVKALSIEEYARLLKNCIATLPGDVVVHRITGDGAKRDLIAPLWSGDKKRTLNFLRDYLANGEGKK